MESYPGNIESQLLSFERPYSIKAPVREGEKVLSKLASTSSQEYAWIFDEDTSIWHYHPAQTSIKINHDIGALEHRLTLPKESEFPPSENSVDYHIHPTQAILDLLENERWIKDGWEMETMIINNQTPSGEDFVACAKRTTVGFKNSKIVTPLGVTTIIFYPEKMSAPTLSFNFKISREQTIKELSEVSDDMTYAIEARFRSINEQLEGLFTVSFEKIE